MAAEVLAADPTSSSKEALNLALVSAFYGPLIAGFGLALAALRIDRRNATPARAGS